MMSAFVVFIKSSVGNWVRYVTISLSLSEGSNNFGI